MRTLTRAPGRQRMHDDTRTMDRTAVLMVRARLGRYRQTRQDWHYWLVRGDGNNRSDMNITGDKPPRIWVTRVYD